MKENKSSPAIFLLAFVALLVVGFLLWPVPEKKPPTTAIVKRQISATSKKAEVLVNKHLWMTSKAQELAQDRMKAQNEYTNPQVGDSIWPQGQPPQKQLGVDHSADTNENTAFQDLNRYRKDLRVQTPDHVIQAQISDENRRREYEEAYRAEYAKQFVENARRNGYDVRLNEDYVVISVRPIRNPSGELGPQAQ